MNNKTWCNKTKIIFFMLSALPFSISLSQSNYTQSSGTVTLSDQTFTSSTTDLSAVKVTGGTFIISNSKISSSGNSSSNDNSSFYGLNAVVLAYASNGTAVINSSGNIISSTGSGANGIFAYGTANITTQNDKLMHTGGGAHAIMCSGGGTITVTNDTAVTSGGSSSTIATDRGGGTITVNGGKYTANGSNSAAIYSTGIITCTNASLITTGAEALVIEGSNKITLNNCTINCSNNKWGSLLYQSMSGDVSGVDNYLTITGGTFTYTGTKGGMFYNTNSTAYINLKGVNLVNSCDTLLRCIKGSWGGSSASSGGISRFTCSGQTMTGLIHVDVNSTNYDTLKNSSKFTGAINNSNTGKLVSLTMDATSSWIVTKNSYLTIISNSAGISGTTCTNITGNGNNVYYNSSNSANSYLGGKTYSLVNGGFLLPTGANAVEESINSLPTGWLLEQNYPNPFNPSTVISYQLPTSSFVTLKVYNILGREITTVVNEYQQAGTHAVIFSTQNYSMASGIYFCKMTTGTFTATKKMILLK